MVQMSVNQLKSGELLLEDVITFRGNLLMKKGTTLSERDLEVLNAYLIEQVEIDENAQSITLTEEVESTNEKAKPPAFHQIYLEMMNLLKKVFVTAAPAIPLPISDIRSKLEELIEASHDYQPLTFVPENFEKEDYLYHNSILVALTAYKLAIWCNLKKSDWIPVALGGLLHDIGTLSIDQKVLLKPEKLSEEEINEVRRHTIIGYNILKNVRVIGEGVKMCALQHHEREDGSGYPLGVKGEKIHLYAKIIAVCDVFHAMAGERYHKEKMSPYIVLEKLHDKSFGKLDPTIVQTFIHKATQMSNGSIVRLSDESIGEIVFCDRSHPTRPWVKVGSDIVNLTSERSLHIVEVIKS